MHITLITGAASGIGLALSIACLQKNMLVIMVDNDRDKLQLETTKLKSLFSDQVYDVTCDITQPEKVAQLASLVQKDFSHIDWIFNNAGIIGPMASLWELNPKDINKVMDVNVYGMIHIIQAFMPLLFKQENPSHIVNVSSLYAICSSSHVGAYAMSKHAVLALSESLYFDIQRLEKPINVSVAFPSFTDTGLLSHNSESSPLESSLNSLLGHSRPAMDVAMLMIQEVEQNKFYIFPDKEVKGYCEERTHAMVNQETPHVNSIEKIIGSLIKRSQK